MREDFVTFASVGDKELDKARTTILAAVPRASTDIRTATKLLRRHRTGLARIANTGTEEATGDQMVRAFVAVQALAVVDHVDKGTPIDKVGATDDEAWHVTVGTAGGWARDLPPRTMRAILVASFLLNAPQLAARLAEMTLAGTIDMLAEAMMGKGGR